MKKYIDKINESAIELKNFMKSTPTVALILGSGLGGVGDMIEDKITINYSDLANFPLSTVEGHAGKFIIGKLSGVEVIAMQGRFHFYEGYSMKDVTFPIRVLQKIGVKNLLLTNASGGVNESFVPGDLMLITDHINNSANNPLIGSNLDEFGPRFQDLTNVYDSITNKKIYEIADSLSIDLKHGVYQFNTGPAYETPAEIKMARIMGADAVGMSTVPEAIVARHGGMKVTGISCITNMAAGILDQPLDHGEVMETAERVKDTFIKLVIGIIPVL